MLKKHKIMASYEIVLYCDKCGKQMFQKTVDLTNLAAPYKYTCECGHEMASKDSFPCQQVYWELEGVEMTQEEWEAISKC